MEQSAAAAVAAQQEELDLLREDLLGHFERILHDDPIM